jgi:hypothetical protein
MPRSPVDDPLLPCTARLPRSLVVQLQSQAEEVGVTFSDVLRSHLTPVAAKPLGNPRPTRRPKLLVKASGADPLLMRRLAGIGNNANQIARGVNTDVLLGTPIQIVQLLSLVMSIEQSLQQIADAHAH